MEGLATGRLQALLLFTSLAGMADLLVPARRRTSAGGMHC